MSAIMKTKIPTNNIEVGRLFICGKLCITFSPYLAEMTDFLIRCPVILRYEQKLHSEEWKPVTLLHGLLKMQRDANQK